MLETWIPKEGVKLVDNKGPGLKSLGLYIDRVWWKPLLHFNKITYHFQKQVPTAMRVTWKELKFLVSPRENQDVFIEWMNEWMNESFIMKDRWFFNLLIKYSQLFRADSIPPLPNTCVLHCWLYLVWNKQTKRLLIYFTCKTGFGAQISQIHLKDEFLQQEWKNFSSRGGLLHKLHDYTMVGLNPARRQKDFRSNSNNTGGALINNVKKLTRLSSLD